LGQRRQERLLHLFLNNDGAGAWPITATTFALMYKNPGDQASGKTALQFFQWGFEKGDQLALGLDYIRCRAWP